jgi:hypothetical protein
MQKILLSPIHSLLKGNCWPINNPYSFIVKRRERQITLLPNTIDISSVIKTAYVHQISIL